MQLHTSANASGKQTTQRNCSKRHEYSQCQILTATSCAHHLPSPLRPSIFYRMMKI